jgi:hypothetical protein
MDENTGGDSAMCRHGVILGLLLVGLTAALAHAQATAPVLDTSPHPHVVVDREWAGVMVIAIVGLVLTAAIVGPVVRANLPAELPPAHSHDEPPGSSGHHGPGGLINPEPE